MRSTARSWLPTPTASKRSHKRTSRRARKVADASAERQAEQARAEQAADRAEAAERKETAQATALEQQARRAEARADAIDPEENR